MSDYIKREDAIKRLCDFSQEGTIPMPYELWENVLKDVPSADVPEKIIATVKIDKDELQSIVYDTLSKNDIVQVVRCRDCKYYREYVSNRGSALMCLCPCCISGQGKKKPTDYCSYGERKDGDKE